MRKDLPAVLGALLLLPVSAGWKDDIWWGHESERLQRDYEYVLPLTSSAGVPCSDAVIATALSRGLDFLMAVEDGALEALYAELLSGDGRASLRGFELPPEALAALLLPLDRERADVLSLLQWSPSEPRGSADADFPSAVWRLAILPNATGSIRAPLPAGASKTARDWVTALREQDPRSLASPRSSLPMTAAPRPRVGIRT